MPTDQQLAGADRPADRLLALLPLLAGGNRCQRSRAAAHLLRSRYASAEVLRALPATIVLRSPWHTGLAAAMVTEACGEHPGRWRILRVRAQGGSGKLTFGDLLDEIRDAVFDPAGQHGYRICRGCRLVTPADHPDDDRRPGGRHDGWVQCRLCRHHAPATATIPADRTLGCPQCTTSLEYPATAAVIPCPGCGTLFANPDLDGTARARLDAVLGDQIRTAEMINDLRQAISQFSQPAAEQQPPGRASDWLQRWQRPAGRPEPWDLGPLPAGALDDDLPLAPQFRAALATALDNGTETRRRTVFVMRYGLNRPAATARDIGKVLGISESRVNELARSCAWSMVFTACMSRDEPAAYADACAVVTHVARRVIGEVDHSDTPQRIRDFVTAALPNARPDAAARLLIRLAGYDAHLGPATTRYLARQVLHANPAS